MGEMKMGGQSVLSLARLLMLALAILLAAGPGRLFLSGSQALANEAPKKDAHGGGKDGAKVEASPFYVVPDFLINLNPADRRTAFLKVSMYLELANPQDHDQIDKRGPILLDYIQGYLRQLRPESLRGSGAMHRLHEGLLLRARTALAPLVIKDVLFKELLVQ
jgi:flagellar FliL protein